MIAYKAFKTGLNCRGYQFHMGLNTTDEANCAQNGFHCAANPLDCLSYYSMCDQTEFYIVNAGGDIDEDNCDSKIACTELTILKKLDLWDFVVHALAYLFDHPRMKVNEYVSREYGEACRGFAIVRGKEPKARGKAGDILALAKESADGEEIIQLGMARVDGKQVLASVWYDIELLPCQLLPAAER